MENISQPEKTATLDYQSQSRVTSLKLVKDSNPYCPQCGRHGQKNGVSLRVDILPIKDKPPKKEHFITCETCRVRYRITNFGVWGPSIDLEKSAEYEEHEGECLD